MTDASLCSLSRLTSLTKILLRNRHNELTTAGIMTLLAGPSRASFRHIRIAHNGNPDRAIIQAEFLVMAAETGLTADDTLSVPNIFSFEVAFRET